MMRTAVLIKSFLVYNFTHEKGKTTLASICENFVSWRLVVTILLDNEFPSRGSGVYRLAWPPPSYIIRFLLFLPCYEKEDNSLILLNV